MNGITIVVPIASLAPKLSQCGVDINSKRARRCVHVWRLAAEAAIASSTDQLATVRPSSHTQGLTVRGADAELAGKIRKIITTLAGSDSWIVD